MTIKGIMKTVLIVGSIIVCLVGCSKETQSQNETEEQSVINETNEADQRAENSTDEAEETDTTEAESEADAESESGSESVSDSGLVVQEETEIFTEIVYEAEDGILNNLEVVTLMDGKDVAGNGFSGTGIVGKFDNTDSKPSTLEFVVEVTKAGQYELVFYTGSPFGDKLNNVTINTEEKGSALTTKNGEEMLPSSVFAQLKAGKNSIIISESWGWIYVDKLSVRSAAKLASDIYSVKPNLINPSATDATKALMRYLVDVYGTSVLSGQNAGEVDSPELRAIYEVTKKYPAVLALDFIDYSPTRTLYGTVGKTTQEAIKWDQKGGIVSFCWHWNAPKDLINTEDNPWWRGFYTDATTFDLEAAMSGDDPDGYQLLLSDIDVIAQQLKQLQEANVPIMWRPLHEASGGWFWWGAKGSDAYIKLWKLMYERMTNIHKLNNLIWVWNGQNKEWYPGDDYVDIIGEDIYATKQSYDSQRERFMSALDYTKTPKLIALTENGVIPDIDNMLEDNVMWLYFATWNGEFTIDSVTKKYSEVYTEKELILRTYASENVITLDELPDIKKY